RDMHEDVCAAVVGLDEAIALGGVEPLHSTCRHLAYLINRRVHAGVLTCAIEYRRGWSEGSPDSTEIEKGITRPTGRNSMARIWPSVPGKSNRRESLSAPG